MKAEIIDPTKYQIAYVLLTSGTRAQRLEACAFIGLPLSMAPGEDGYVQPATPKEIYDLWQAGLIDTTFMVSINDGPEQSLTTQTGIHRDAAAAALAMLKYEIRPHMQIVKIWVPGLLPDYGPYYFGVGDDDFGNLVVKTLAVLPENPAS